MDLVEQAVRAWEAERTTVIAQIEDIPEDQLDFRPGEGARSVREIAFHIAGSQIAIVSEIIRPDGSFFRLFDPTVQQQIAALIPPASTRAELVEMLRSVGEQSAGHLRDAGEPLVTRTMQTLRGVESCLTAVHFGAGHEMYHCGQLAICARALGREPQLTQRLNAMLAQPASDPQAAPPPVA
jgi:uncharacterized damage-inducible protein DinB